MPRKNSKHLTDPGIAKIGVAEEYTNVECLERRLENGKFLAPKLKRVWEVERIIQRIGRWRLHDLRRTARTGLAELAIPQIVAEKVLNHAKRNQLVKTYDRHHYAGEKRDALDRWAN